MPGGPTRSTPEGALAPSFVNLSGDLNNSCKHMTEVSQSRSGSGVDQGGAEGCTHHEDLFKRHMLKT